MKGIKISELEKMLESVKERLGDVEVYCWDSSDKNSVPFPVTGINCEGDHVELT